MKCPGCGAPVSDNSAKRDLAIQEAQVAFMRRMADYNVSEARKQARISRRHGMCAWIPWPSWHKETP